MPIHRQIKNVVHNYTDAERKVREATSNDPWGPSSTLMAEIADKTHNAMALPEIMRMIWRRLNDRGKNWRHIYKSLVLLGYLIKMGSEKVATQCRENIHAIETLKEFEYIEDGKDLGHNVRARANAVAALLRNRELLEEEREKALLARERLTFGGMGTVVSSRGSPNALWQSGHQRSSDAYTRAGTSPNYMRTTPSSSSHPINPEVDSFRPQSVGEEELQLQLALAISKEEHDREESRRRDEEAKVQMALEQSKQISSNNTNSNSGDGSGLFNLLDTSLSAAPANLPDPWSAVAGSSVAGINTQVKPPPPIYAPTVSAIPIDDPWGCPTPVGHANDVRNASGVAGAALEDNLWSLQQSLEPPLLELGSNSVSATGEFLPRTNGPVDAFHGHNGVSNGLVAAVSTVPQGSSASPTDEVSKTESRRTPADFLGEHQRLVDLDKLIEKPPNSTNPFATAPRDFGRGASSNPFLSGPSAKPSLNELAPSRVPPPQALPPPTAFSSSLVPAPGMMAAQNRSMVGHNYMGAAAAAAPNPGGQPFPPSYLGQPSFSPFNPLMPSAMAYPTNPGQPGAANAAASNPFF